MKLKALSSAVILASLVACGGGGGGGSETPAPSGIDLSSNLESVGLLLETNADIALAAYNDSVDTAGVLARAIDALAADPTQATLDAAKAAWLVSREPYGQTEVYRFRLSPIDSTDGVSEDGLEGDINAWPLGEALIDDVVIGNDFGDDQVGVTDFAIDIDHAENPQVNIINSGITIDEDLLSLTATADDEHDVIAGYHAIEFLLWGQDLNRDGSADTLDNRDLNTSDDITMLNSGGQRPVTDFTDATLAGDTNETLGERRLQYLQVAAAKLVSDLESVRDGWVEGADYRETFTEVVDTEDAQQKLTEILTGMGTLSQGELAGERMQIAFSTGSQEDEHSCFSDNTHRDIWLNAEGISNSYYGVYNGFDSTLDGTDNVTDRVVDGFGFDDLAEVLDSETFSALASALDTSLQATEAAYVEIDASARAGQPVDVLIQDANRFDENNPMALTILALDTQSNAIVAFAEGLNIDEVVVDPDGTACDTSDPTTTCED